MEANETENILKIIFFLSSLYPHVFESQELIKTLMDRFEEFNFF